MLNDLYFDGRLAKEPKLLESPGKKAVCFFTLIHDEYAGQGDAGPRERQVALPFTAFAGQAKFIASHAMVGDEISVKCRVENSKLERNGETEYGFSFVVEKIKLGEPGKLKREQLARAEG